MLDDFFLRALLAGCGVALVAGPLGCFMVWRRLAYFGDTLAHSALLGIALAYLLDGDPTVAVFGTAALIAIAMLFLRQRAGVATDSILGLMAHSSLALGLLCLALLTWVRVDLMAVLVGDILSVTKQDLLVIYGGGALVLASLIAFWRPLFAATVSRDLAEAEGARPFLTEAGLLLLMALTIAIAIKVVGVLLITALLIIPAAAARRLATTPEAMAILAALLGLVAVIGGLFGSLEWDTPSGPSIVVAAMCLFLVGLFLPTRFARRDTP